MPFYLTEIKDKRRDKLYEAYNSIKIRNKVGIEYTVCTIGIMADCGTVLLKGFYNDIEYQSQLLKIKNVFKELKRRATRVIYFSLSEHNGYNQRLLIDAAIKAGIPYKIFPNRNHNGTEVYTFSWFPDGFIPGNEQKCETYITGEFTKYD